MCRQFAYGCNLTFRATRSMLPGAFSNHNLYVFHLTMGNSIPGAAQIYIKNDDLNQESHHSGQSHQDAG